MYTVEGRNVLLSLTDSQTDRRTDKQNGSQIINIGIEPKTADIELATLGFLQRQKLTATAIMNV